VDENEDEDEDEGEDEDEDEDDDDDAQKSGDVSGTRVPVILTRPCVYVLLLQSEWNLSFLGCHFVL
jgi:hypothetical protein